MMEQGRKPEDKVQLKLRFREELRKALEESARGRAHSLNAEIVARLEESVRASRDVDLAFGGAHSAALLRLLAGEIGLVETKTGRRWHEDIVTFLEVAAALVETINRLLEREKSPSGAEELARPRRRIEAQNRRFEQLRAAGRSGEVACPDRVVRLGC